MSEWAAADKWRQEQLRLWDQRFCALLRYGWLMLRSNDGKFWARRFRESDAGKETLYPDGEPEIRANTFEILLAEVQLRANATKKVGVA